MMESFNTLEAARKLQEAGCSQKVADEIASQINGAIEGTVASKSDFEAVRKDIEHLGSATKSGFEAVRKEIKHLESGTKSEFEVVRKDIELLKSQLTARLWAAIAAFVVLMKALDYLLPTVLG